MQLKANGQTRSFSRPWMGGESIHVGEDGIIHVDDGVGEWLLADDGIDIERIDDPESTDNE